jgi:signal peptidase I
MSVSKKELKNPKISNVAAAKAKQKEVEKPFRDKIIENVKSLAWALGVFYFVQTFFLQTFAIPTGSMETTLLPGDFIFVNKFVYGAQTPENIPFTDIELPRFSFPSFKEPQQGDVVVFRFPHPELYPSQRGLDYIKRCVASAGQTLEVKNKELYVNGVKFIDQFSRSGIHYGAQILQKDDVFPPTMGTRDNFGPLRVPAKGDELSISNATAAFVQYLALRDGHKFESRGDGYYVDGIKSEKYSVGQDYFFMMGDNRDNSLDSRYWGPVPRDHISGEGLLVYLSNKEAAQETSVILKLLKTINIFQIKWNRIGTIIR